MESNFLVSELFLEIYKKFNVCSQIEKMNLLSRKELFLMLTLAVDSFNEENLAVIENCRPFKRELEIILALQDDESVEDPDILELSKEIGEKYIDTHNLISSSGKLPKPLSDEEALILRRDLSIDSVTK